MPQFRYVGPEGSFMPTQVHAVDGENVRGLEPVPGEVYDLRFERHDADPEDAKVRTDPGPGWERVKESKQAAQPPAAE